MKKVNRFYMFVFSLIEQNGLFGGLEGFFQVYCIFFFKKFKKFLKKGGNIAILKQGKTFALYLALLTLFKKEVFAQTERLVF